jgi:L-alanine-DL-glutamate epimerase-like enolase superfamily enzyme
MAASSADSGREREMTVEELEVGAYVIPTDAPESDGTLRWQATTMVVVHARAGEIRGLGYTYADAAAARLIRENLRSVVIGGDAMAVSAAWLGMLEALRNQGRTGISAMAVSAVDCALWDLKARLLNLPLASLLGQMREGVPIYGSGGFTSYDEQRLTAQLAGWVEQGIPRVKMKVGRDPAADPGRVAAVRRAVGDGPELYVDANGGYGRKQALALGRRFAEHFGVSWFEEPRPSDDLEGLRLLRDRGPVGLDIAAGEYGFEPVYFKRMLEAGAVDCLQADVTRCAGITGFIQAAHLCEAFQVPLSGHCAPAQHLHPACAVIPLRHVEYFHDHVRIEGMLFDGVAVPRDGRLYPDLSRPGNGLEFKAKDAMKFAV